MLFVIILVISVFDNVKIEFIDKLIFFVKIMKVILNVISVLIDI